MYTAKDIEQMPAARLRDLISGLIDMDRWDLHGALAWLSGYDPKAFAAMANHAATMNAARGPDGCPATTVYDEGDDHFPLFCGRERGHGGSHHAGPFGDGSEIMWDADAGVAA